MGKLVFIDPALSDDKECAKWLAKCNEIIVAPLIERTIKILKEHGIDIPEELNHG